MSPLNLCKYSGMSVGLIGMEQSLTFSFVGKRQTLIATFDLAQMIRKVKGL